LDTITLFREGLVLVVLLSAPILIVTTVLGIFISLAQGLFQIQDQALSYTVKLVAFTVVLLITGRWMSNELVSLTKHMFALVGQVR
jgi:type III secretion protein S